MIHLCPLAGIEGHNPQSSPPAPALVVGGVSRAL